MVNYDIAKAPSSTAYEIGRYSGLYRRKGQSLFRESDQLELRFVDRQSIAQTPSKAQTYLLDHSVVGGKYVSSLWGKEFEYQRLRYRIGQSNESPDLYEIVVLRRCKSKGKARV
jgi:hypothetical protein